MFFTNSTAAALPYEPCFANNSLGAQKLLLWIPAGDANKTYTVALKEFVFVLAFDNIDLGRMTGEWQCRHDDAGKRNTEKEGFKFKKLHYKELQKRVQRCEYE